MSSNKMKLEMLSSQGDVVMSKGVIDGNELHEYIVKNGEGSRPDDMWIEDICIRLEDGSPILLNPTTDYEYEEGLVWDLVMNTVRDYLKDNPLVLCDWIGSEIIEEDFYINPDTGRDHYYDE